MPDLGMRFWGEIRGKQALERQPAAAASAGGQKTSWWQSLLQKFVGFFQTSRPPAAEPSLGQSPRSGEAQHMELAGNPDALADLQAQVAPPPEDLSVEEAKEPEAKEPLVKSVINSVDSNEAGVKKLFEIVKNPTPYLDPEALRSSDEAGLKKGLQTQAVEKLKTIASNTSINGNVRSKALEAVETIFRDPQIPRVVKWPGSDSMSSGIHLYAAPNKPR